MCQLIITTQSSTTEVHVENDRNQTVIVSVLFPSISFSLAVGGCFTGGGALRGHVSVGRGGLGASGGDSAF